jgi:hypothetical protein
MQVPPVAVAPGAAAEILVAGSAFADRVVVLERPSSQGAVATISVRGQRRGDCPV